MAAPRAEEKLAGRIAYSRKDGDRAVIHIMNADGSGDRLLPGVTANVGMFPAWSPDGKRLALMTGQELNGQSYQITIINADGTGAKTLNFPFGLTGAPAWNPDGKRIAFVAGNDNAPPHLYVADADGNGLRQLSPEGGGGFFPCWTPDGKGVYYSRITGPDIRKAEIVLRTLDGGEEPVTNTGLIAFVGAHGLSPDGKRLLFVALQPEERKTEVRVWDLAAKAETFFQDLTATQESGPESFTMPCWAPDGKSFLVTLRTEKGSAIFRVSADGKTKTRVTPEGVDCFGPAWTASSG